MADGERHRAKLQQLNRNFIRSVEEADVAWFDANLAPDFFNTNSDGSFIDRKAFLAQIARGSSVKNIREHGVLIRILDEFAIIHDRFSYQKPDGTEGAGRYAMIGSCAADAGNAFPPNRRGSSTRYLK
jgi:hypothetical protein